MNITIDVLMGAGFAALGLWIMVKWFKQFWKGMAIIASVKFLCLLLIGLWPNAGFTVVPRVALIPVEYVQKSVMMSVYHLGKGDEQEGQKIGKNVKKVWMVMEKEVNSSQK